MNEDNFRNQMNGMGIDRMDGYGVLTTNNNNCKLKSLQMRPIHNIIEAAGR